MTSLSSPSPRHSTHHARHARRARRTRHARHARRARSGPRHPAATRTSVRGMATATRRPRGRRATTHAPTRTARPARTSLARCVWRAACGCLLGKGRKAGGPGLHGALSVEEVFFLLALLLLLLLLVPSHQRDFNFTLQGDNHDARPDDSAVPGAKVRCGRASCKTMVTSPLPRFHSPPLSVRPPPGAAKEL